MDKPHGLQYWPCEKLEAAQLGGMVGSGNKCHFSHGLSGGRGLEVDNWLVLKEKGDRAAARSENLGQYCQQEVPTGDCEWD